MISHQLTHVLARTRLWIFCLTLVWVGGSHGIGWAQSFQEVSTSVFTGVPDDVAGGDVVWGDYDTDGDLDLLVTGDRSGFNNPSTAIYEYNSTSNRFSPLNLAALGIPEIGTSRCTWGDYDNDGDLDLLLVGQDAMGTRYAVLYRYSPLLGFSTLGLSGVNAILGAAAVSNGAATFADYNNDGYLDIAIAGNQNSPPASPTLRLFRNQGPTGLFGFAADTVLLGIGSPSMDWGDYDNDGDLDLLIAGSNNLGNPVTKLYGNTGNGNFVDIVGVPFPDLRNGSVEWGDYDNDGDLDVLLSGDNGSTPFTQLYKNDGNNGFNLVNISLTNVTQGEATWVDYNLDGWIDLFIIGQNGTSTSNRGVSLYRNTQNGTFALESGLSSQFTALNGGARVAWGDFNDDDKVDVLLTGTDNIGNPTLELYRNNLSLTNPTLSAPIGLSAIQSGTSVNFFWQAPASVSATEEKGLSYNLYLLENSGGSFVRGPEADFSSGKRLMARLGAIKDTFWRISGLTPGTYTWAVQAVDGGFEGSPWSSTQSVTYTSPFSSTSVFTTDLSNRFPLIPGPPPGLDNVKIVWGDLDNNNHLDFVIAGTDNVGNTITRIYFYDPSNGEFDENDTAIPEDFRFGDIALGDCDNDGDLDIAISGFKAGVPVVRDLKVYQNQYLQNGTFTPVTLPSGLGNINGSLDWGDYDADGDLDLLITGQATGNLFRILPNTFIQQKVISFGTAFDVDPTRAFALSDAQFGDYNRDNLPDILVSGQTGTSTRASLVFKNMGDGTFSNIGLSLPGLFRSQVEWTDFNNDGNLDFLVSGLSGTNIPTVFARTYSDAADAFVNFNVSTITPVGFGSIDFGDFNDDGWPDLLLTGQTTSAGNVGASKIYLNNADPSNLAFLEDANSSSTLAQLYLGSSATWADYNGDKKLDIVLAGRSNAGNTPTFHLYRNIESTPNAVPDAPFNVRHSIEGFNVRITWSAPRAANPITKEGLSYAVYLVKQGTTDTLMRYLAAETALAQNGFRRNVGLGNVYQARELLLEDVTPGTYTYSVQTIDQDFEGSSFSAQGTFSFDFPSFSDSTLSYFQLNRTPLRQASIALGDYSGDGSLDLIMLGLDDNNQRQTKLYTYDQAARQFLPDIFNEDKLADLSNGSIDWGDVNNDGNLDLLLTGESASGPFAQVYYTQSGAIPSGQFISLTGIQHGVGQFIDYNHDGFQDILLLGEGSGGAPVVKMYRHNRSTQTNPYVDEGNLGVLPALEQADAAFADYNNDGYVDLLLAGNTGSGRRAALYTNTGTGTFVNTSVPALNNIDESSIAWADYNNDGWVDVIVTGRRNSGPATLLLENQAGSGFAATGSFQGIRDGVAKWCDYNLDRYSDLLLAGNTDNGANRRVSLLYRNPAAPSSFIQDNVAAAPIVDLNNGADATWGDINQDGKPDLILVGQRFSSPDSGAIQLLVNIRDTVPNPLLAPRNPDETVNAFEVELRWDPPANISAALAKGLSYNVMLGTSSNAIDQRAPLAAVPSGARQIVAQGQVWDTTAFRFRNLPTGSYFWRVQAIDQDLEGSPFSIEGQFDFEPPAFVDESETTLPALPSGLQDGDLAWADIEGDGDLDLAVMGHNGSTPFTDIFINTNGILTAGNIGLVQLSEGSLDWADFNQDNLPDLLICGKSSSGTPILEIYQNNGNTTFGTVGSGLPGIMNGVAKWVDLDADGDQDVVLAGNDGANLLTQAYINDEGTFVSLGLNLDGVEGAAIAVADFDQNFFMDAVITGLDRNGIPISQLLLNQGTGQYSIQKGTNSGLIDLGNGSADVADMDGDGVPDLLLTGDNALGAPLIQLYQFDNLSNQFTSTPGFTATGTVQGQARIADYNEDGRYDFVVCGNTAGSLTSLLYTQQANGTFVEEDVLSLGIPDLGRSALAWGDYNTDGKIDLAILGSTSVANTRRVFRILTNTDITAAQSPDAPLNSALSIAGDTAILSWQAPASAEGYTYNVYLSRSTPGDEASPLALLNSGYRLKVGPGNAGEQQVFKIKGLPDGTYSWGVQSIAPDYEGSAFLNGGSFSYEQPSFINNNIISVDPSTFGFQDAVTDWADIDDDGDLDLFVIGQATSPKALVYRNDNGKLVFVSGLDAAIQDLRNGCGQFADYDNDGLPDLAISGISATSNEAVVQLYHNDGGVFSLTSALQGIGGVSHGALAWGDANQDGRQDILLAGLQAGAAITTLLVQSEQGFVPYGYTTFPGFLDPAIAWADFDGDRDQDVAIAGLLNGTPTTHVYANRGPQQGFNLLNTPNIPGISNGSLAWGNRENDGDLDLLICGENAGGTPITRVIRRNNSNGFVQPQTLNGITNGNGIWGDYDDDGDADIILSGQNASGDPAIYVYDNNNGGFVLNATTSDAMLGASPAALAWTDIDKDRKLDLSIVGLQNSQSGLTIYRNIEGSPNVSPSAPTGLSHTLAGDSVIFSWDSGPNAAGITYNVYVGPSTNLAQALSPLAQISGSSDGLRKVLRLGNAGPRTGLSINDLSEGKYYWAVQAIDPDLEGSPFSAVDSFTYEPSPFVLDNLVVFDSLTTAGFEEGALLWADYDLDEDLDLLAIGTNTVVLYQNQHGFRFKVDQPNTDLLPPLSEAGAIWLDIDQNGAADLILSGRGVSGPEIHLYTNENGVLTEQPFNLPALNRPHFTCGDFNRDGQMDLAYQGTNTSGNPQIVVLENNGSNGFQPLGSGFNNFVDLHQGDIICTDINGDGFGDLISCGVNSQNEGQVFLYQFDRLQGFIRSANFLPALEETRNTRIAAGDYDNDGYPDIAITGSAFTGSNTPLQVYHNEAGSGNFQLLSLDASISGVDDGDLQWGDLSGDGFLDLIWAGADAAGVADVQVLIQNAGVFELDPSANTILQGVEQGAALALADANLDGRLDVAIAGRLTGNSLSLNFYRNNYPTSSLPPLAPEMPSIDVVGSDIKLIWEAPNGAPLSEVSGYRYNVFVGIDSAGVDSIDRVSPLSSLQSGFRQLVGQENGTYRTEFIISGLEVSNDYVWGVQAVDQQYQGSPFIKRNFSYRPAAFTDVSNLTFTSGGSTDRPNALLNGAILLGDYNQDSTLDMVVSGLEVGGTELQTQFYQSQLVRLPGNPPRHIFSEDLNNAGVVPGIQDGTLEWFDLDGDNDLDLFICGQGSNANTGIARVYLNDNGQFTLLDQDGLVPVRQAAADVADFDGDGDPDIFVIGRDDNGQARSILYENQGGSLIPFETIGEVDFTDVAEGSVAWGDFDIVSAGDNKNRKDLFFCGRNNSGDIVARIYRNRSITEPEDPFNEVGTQITGTINGDAYWRDLDGDGNPELLLTGTDNQGEASSNVYWFRNDGQFIALQHDLPALSSGQILVGDYDDDTTELADVLLVGERDGVPIVELFRNQSEPIDVVGSILTFVNDPLSSRDLDSTNIQVVAWGDLNADNKIDLVSASAQSFGISEQQVSVFQNIDENPDIPVGSIANLSREELGADMMFSWDPLSPYYSYHFFLERLDSATNLWSPVGSTATGFRFQTKQGNMGSNTEIVVPRLPSGTFRWGVQAVGPDYIGGPYTIGETFSFIRPVPEINASLIPTYASDSISDFLTLAEATVVDTSLVKAVEIRYKPIADSIWQTETLPVTGNEFSFAMSLDNNRIDELGCEYLFVAIGKFGYNDQTDTLYTYRRYANGVSETSLNTGKETADYNFVSVPLELDETDVALAIGDEFGRYGPYRWRFWTYDPTTTSTVEYVEDGSGLANTLLPGKGYWILSKRDGAYTTPPGNAVQANDRSPYVLQLEQGWNQVGNPYNFNLFWPDILAASSNSLLKLYVFQPNQGFSENPVLSARRGGFVFADSATALTIPVRKNPQVAKIDPITLQAQGNLAALQWRLPIHLASGDRAYRLASVGMHPEANESKDPFDDILPPRFGPVLDMYTLHEEYFAPAFTGDIIPPKSTQVWEFVISTNLGEEEIRLEWPEIEGDSRHKLYLFDEEEQLYIDMVAQQTYISHSEANQRPFRIVYGDPVEVASLLEPNKVFFGRISPNPTQGAVQLRLALPPVNGATHVSVELYDQGGKLLETIWQETLPGGHYLKKWTAPALPNGIYLLKLTAQSPNQTEVMSRRLIIRR